MGVERTEGKRPVVRALVSSGGPVLGVLLGSSLARGFSWGDVGAMVVIWAVLFCVLLFFLGRERSGRRR